MSSLVSLVKKLGRGRRSFAPWIVVAMATGCSAVVPSTLGPSPYQVIPAPPPRGAVTLAGAEEAFDDAPVPADRFAAPDEAAVASASGVGASGVLAEPGAASAPLVKTHLYAPAGLLKVHDKPDRDAPVIGALRAGQSIRVKSSELTFELRQRRLYLCDEGWYPVEPRGYVCAGGGDHATWDAKDARVVAARAALPDVNADYPFKYGVSVGAPRYLRIPTKAEQRANEKNLDAYLANLPAPDDEKGGAVDRSPAGQGPSADLAAYLGSTKLPVVDPAGDFYEGYKVSWTKEIDAHGRTWLLTPDMAFIPKDKVRQKKLPHFKGVDLTKSGLKLPLAFFWLDDAHKYREGDGGKLVETTEVVPRHSFAETTMGQRMGPGGIYWGLSDGSWVQYPKVSIIKPTQYRPSGVGRHDKWVEVRITWGYLVAYVGNKPVYATAMSPGVDGIAARKHATARGRHYVAWKMLSGDMSGNDKGKDWYVDEVPWVQYYQGNYALHGAWWHNDYGRPKSHGCVNLAPADARHLFGWMDPQIPDGWYAVSTYYPYNKGTLIMIRP